MNRSSHAMFFFSIITWNIHHHRHVFHSYRWYLASQMVMKIYNNPNNNNKIKLNCQLFYIDNYVFVLNGVNKTFSLFESLSRLVNPKIWYQMVGSFSIGSHMDWQVTRTTTKLNLDIIIIIIVRNEREKYEMK